MRAGTWPPTEKAPLEWYSIVGVSLPVTMQAESVTKRSHGYDVWFTEERTWTARSTWAAPAELYPDEKGRFRVFDC